MSSLYEKQREYARTHQVPFDKDDWDQMCGNLMHRFNTWLGWGNPPTGDVSSAYRVAMRSGWLNPDASKAPIGAWHYFSIAGEANGHVMQDGLAGGHTCLMAGWSVFEDLGKAIGFQSVSGYVSAKAGRAEYLGWSLHYANGTANPNYTTSTAGNGATPLEEDDMYTTEDRARDDIAAWRIGQIKATLDEIAAGRGVVNAKLDTIQWAVGDPAVGLRRMVADLDNSEATPLDLSAIAKAVQDEEDRRTRERLDGK